MRVIPSAMDPAIVADIDSRLADVARDERVRIPWAIESGSRAWGFPSPDSDYDCRFIFIRPRARYLTLWPERDVIELELDDTFDVNGWDLGKALKLIVKGNATAIEWLRSPIVYAGDESFRDRLLEFADAVADRDAIVRHYLSVAQRQMTQAGSLKRFFYALRPAATLRWLREHPESTTPPMDLPSLIAQTDVDDDVRVECAQLIALKAKSRELGPVKPPKPLRSFVRDEIAQAAGTERRTPKRAIEEARLRADEFFLAELD